MIVGNFNPDVGTIRIPVTKSGKPRHVVLTDEGRGFLRRSLSIGRVAEFLPRGNGRPRGQVRAAMPLVAACKAARVDPAVNFHGLRHTYASRFAMRDVLLAVITAQLGHADIRMVE